MNEEVRHGGKVSAGYGMSSVEVSEPKSKKEHGT